MKKQLIALGAFAVFALGALPGMAACPCQSHSFLYQPAAPCCPAAPVITPCCPAQTVRPCCPAMPMVKPCCPAPCVESCPCPAAPIQPCCDKPATCDDCCD